MVARIRNSASGKMVTGDHANIARETARQIGMRSDILRRDVLADGAGGRTDAERAAIIEAADGFAQVMPKDKNLVVRALQERGFIVGMTGDGVNDAPALQQAHIGIAVEGSTDAARNAATSRRRGSRRSRPRSSSRARSSSACAATCCTASPRRSRSCSC